VGVDLVSLGLVRRWVRRYERATLRLVFTDRELEACRGGVRPERRYAARFAAKEAVVKALGVAGSRAKLDEIEIDLDSSGGVDVVLSGAAQASAQAAGFASWSGSCSTTRRYAMCVVVAEAGRSAG
jgi:holo-[acyl-carrier protein] synthase